MKKAILSLLILAVLAAAGYWWQQQKPATLQGYEVMPPRPLTPMVLLDYDNNNLGIDFLQRGWTYVAFADNQCDAVCLELLNLMKQASASSQKPIKQLLVMGYEPEPAAVAKLRADFPDLQIAVLTRSIWSIFTVQFIPVMETLSGQGIFMVGPFGMIRMAYDELASEQQMRADQAIMFARVNQ